MPLSSSARSKITELVGTASMCWIPRPYHEVFDQTAAMAVVDSILEVIHTEFVPRGE